MATSASERTFFQVFMTGWVPVLLYVSAILLVSAQPGLRPPPGLGLSDKAYHMIEYGGLGLLLVRALRGSLRLRLPIVAALIAIGVGLLIGVSDECFQAFVPGRESSIFDVLADVTGLIVAQIVYMYGARE